MALYFILLFTKVLQEQFEYHSSGEAKNRDTQINISMTFGLTVSWKDNEEEDDNDDEEDDDDDKERSLTGKK